MDAVPSDTFEKVMLKITELSGLVSGDEVYHPSVITPGTDKVGLRVPPTDGPVVIPVGVMIEASYLNSRLQLLILVKFVAVIGTTAVLKLASVTVPMVDIGAFWQYETCIVKVKRIARRLILFFTDSVFKV
jgi:hypothetical protein